MRELTYTDLTNALQEGRLKLVLRKQRDNIERVLPLRGHEAMKELAPELELFFNEQKCKVLGESFRKRGQIMHEKANREIKKAKESFQTDAVLSSHSFRAGFITQHLKHRDLHKVSQFIGHKNITTTQK